MKMKRYKLLLIALLIVGCATKPVENRKPTEYTMKMNEDEFKAKNNELEIFEQNKDGIVYIRKECFECNAEYYTFIYGKLEAVTSFPVNTNPMNFGYPTPMENTPVDSTDTD